MACPLKTLIVFGAISALLLVTPALAVGLTDSDFDYLAGHDIKKGSPVLNGLSPKEQSRLHLLINDPLTNSDTAARAKAVHDALMEFEGHQNWEKMNPGQLWDSPYQKAREP